MSNEKQKIRGDVLENLWEIEAICVGADSPDAIANGLTNPKSELENCRKDISAISNIVETIQGLIEKIQDLEWEEQNV